MIRMSVGNVGSGKTILEVKNMLLDPRNRPTYSNIKTKGIKHNHMINKSMIVKEEEIKLPRSTKIKYSLNDAFWKKVPKPINVVLDEAHNIMDARRSMSTMNIIVNKWMALIRRVLGEDSTGYGELVLITQFPFRLDRVTRDMTTQVRHHRCYWVKTCLRCGYRWREHSDLPEELNRCRKCLHFKLKKTHHWVLIHFFNSVKNYDLWYELGEKTYYKKPIRVRNIKKYFGMYDTFQWENMFE